jgi:hypothetical protein
MSQYVCEEKVYYYYYGEHDSEGEWEGEDEE